MMLPLLCLFPPFRSCSTNLLFDAIIALWRWCRYFSRHAGNGEFREFRRDSLISCLGEKSNPVSKSSRDDIAVAVLLAERTRPIFHTANYLLRNYSRRTGRRNGYYMLVLLSGNADNEHVAIDKFSRWMQHARLRIHNARESLTRSSSPAKRVMHPRARAALRVYNGTRVWTRQINFRRARTGEIHTNLTRRVTVAAEYCTRRDTVAFRRVCISRMEPPYTCARAYVHTFTPVRAPAFERLHARKFTPRRVARARAHPRLYTRMHARTHARTQCRQSHVRTGNLQAIRTL